MKLTRKQFLKLIGGSVTGGAVSGFMSAAGAGPAALPNQNRAVRNDSATLIKGAEALTMDGALGDLTKADVYIENGKIVDVSRKSLNVRDANVVDAEGMILMPGMVDLHRHSWQAILAGYLSQGSSRPGTSSIENYFFDILFKLAISYQPEDAHFGAYLGGLLAIDSGVTSVVDHCHITHTPEKGEALTTGLLRSGVSGIFCYKMAGTPGYGPGDSISLQEAWDRSMAPPDAWHIEQAEELKWKYFSSDSGNLRFGIAMSEMEFGKRTTDEIHNEFATARSLGAELLTHHLFGKYGAWRMDLPESYRLIPDLYKSGLLDSDYLASHGTELRDDELEMIRDSGAGLACTVTGEATYGIPPKHGIAHRMGIPVGIGMDTMVGLTHDYFVHVRNAYWSLFQYVGDERSIPYAMTTRDVLNFATQGGANAMGKGEECGSITPGKQADLVLLRTDGPGFPVSGDLPDRVMHFGGLHCVDSVWVGGELRKQNGVMLGVDWTKIRNQTRLAKNAVVERSKTIELTGELSNKEFW